MPAPVMAMRYSCWCFSLAPRNKRLHTSAGCDGGEPKRRNHSGLLREKKTVSYVEGPNSSSHLSIFQGSDKGTALIGAGTNRLSPALPEQTSHGRLIRQTEGPPLLKPFYYMVFI